jgi:riboflavin kinase/FMN adenylyltransferase
MHGTVVHGEGRGATIGFPTANIAWHDSYIIPAIGIYAVTVKHLDTGKTYGGMLSIGLKPTFHENLAKPEMEVNIFDYSGDLYDSEIEVTFIAHMRPEVKFAGVQELVEQLAKDAVHAREILRKEAR